MTEPDIHERLAPEKAEARAWFEALRDDICASFETIENDPDDNKMAISVLQTPFSLRPTDSQCEALARRKVDWGNVVRANRRVKTRPTKLKEDVASMLVYHGYVMAWVVFTKSGGSHTLPDPEEFQKRWFG